jgi:ABC-type Mn2+/Zn2+ transport system ATPase subunit
VSSPSLSNIGLPSLGGIDAPDRPSVDEVLALIWPHATAGHWIMSDHQRLAGSDGRTVKRLGIIDLFGYARLRGSGEPSGGQSRRVAIARAPFRSARVKVLNPPTTAVDVSMQGKP